MQEWCTIESDPGVFTQLIKQLGVNDVSVDEIYDLNDDTLIAKLEPIYGFIFLFRWTTKAPQRESLKIYDPDLFFAKQVIQNACATQAIISILLNNNQIDIGQELKSYKDFVMDFDPKDRGLSLGNSELIRQTHNSFSRPEPFIFSGSKKAKEGDKVYHFISYIQFKDKVYELDGLEDGPILLGENKDNNWISIAREAIMKRISIYQESEITFTLLAVNKCKEKLAKDQIKQLELNQYSIYNQMNKSGQALSQQQQNEYNELKNAYGQIMEEEQQQQSLEELNQKLQSLQNEIEQQKLIIIEQQDRREQQKKENERRKHNYIPVILEILKMAAGKQQLESLIEQARAKSQK